MSSSHVWLHMPSEPPLLKTQKSLLQSALSLHCAPNSFFVVPELPLELLDDDVVPELPLELLDDDVVPELPLEPLEPLEPLDEELDSSLPPQATTRDDRIATAERPRKERTRMTQLLGRGKTGGALRRHSEDAPRRRA